MQWMLYLSFTILQFNFTFEMDLRGRVEWKRGRRLSMKDIEKSADELPPFTMVLPCHSARKRTFCNFSILFHRLHQLLHIQEHVNMVSIVLQSSVHVTICAFEKSCFIKNHFFSHLPCFVQPEHLLQNDSEYLMGRTGGRNKWSYDIAHTARESLVQITKAMDSWPQSLRPQNGAGATNFDKKKVMKSTNFSSNANGAKWRISRLVYLYHTLKYRSWSSWRSPSPSSMLTHLCW